jgi:hypothetical protein
VRLGVHKGYQMTTNFASDTRKIVEALAIEIEIAELEE